MRIGFDAKRAFNNRRGLGNYSRETLRILTSLAPENQYHLFTPGIDASIGFACPPNAILQTSEKNGKLSQSLWRTFSIAKEAERLGLDIYHGLSHELPYGIEKTKIHTVITMHDLLFLNHPELYPAFDRMMYRKKYLRSCKVADRIVASSEQTKRDLLELTDVDANKVEVVYQGCRPEFKMKVKEAQKQQLRKQYGLPENYLLNVGAIEPRKNQLLILKALKAGHIDMPLVIAGQGTDYLKELQSYMDQQGLQGQVIILPNFPFADLPALYQCASVFVFPSIYEGFGIPMVEALTSGIPVIASTGSCLEESGGPNSLYVSPDDEEALASGINKILSDKQLRDAMVTQGLDYAQRFSDEAIAKNLITTYTSLLS